MGPQIDGISLGVGMILGPVRLIEHEPGVPVLELLWTYGRDGNEKEETRSLNDEEPLYQGRSQKDQPRLLAKPTPVSQVQLVSAIGVQEHGVSSAQIIQNKAPETKSTNNI